MRTIIFSTNEESGPLQDLLGGVIFKRGYNATVVKALLNHLDQDPDAVAIVVGDALLMGWSTPHPAQVLFSRKYHTDELVRKQARGRVRFVDTSIGVLTPKDTQINPALSH